jgi:hypothetical protein
MVKNECKYERGKKCDRSGGNETTTTGGNVARVSAAWYEPMRRTLQVGRLNYFVTQGAPLILGFTL